MKEIAQVNLAPAGGFKGIGTGPLVAPGSNAVTVFAKFISSTIGIMTIVAFIWFVFNVFIAAIGIISAGGDKQNLETARNKMRNNIIGVVVVVAAIFLINIIGTLIGIPNILDVQALFNLVIK